MVMLTWSWFGELDIVVTARGRVINDGQIKSIQSPVNGSVAKIKVLDGDFVKTGDVLLELDSTAFQADIDAIEEKFLQINADLKRLDAELVGAQPLFSLSEMNPTIKERNNSQISLHQARQRNLLLRKEELQATLASRRATLTNGETALKGVETRLIIAKEKEVRARPYVDVAIPRFQYLQWKDDVQILENEIAMQLQTNTRLSHDIKETQQRFLQISSTRQQEISIEINDKKTALALVKTDLTKAKKRANDAIIRSPQDGFLQKISVTTLGATVNQNDVLVQLVPANTPLIIEVMIPNEEKGYLRIGQSVDIKLDAFPFQKYGRINGQLDWVSPDAELSNNLNSSLLTQSAQLRTLNNTPQYVYRGKVTPKADSNVNIKLSPGLTASIDIYTDKRRIIDFFLFPLQNSLDEAMRVR
jgi:hemolysin D